MPDGYRSSQRGGVVTPPIQDETIFPLPNFDFAKGKLWWGSKPVAWRRQVCQELVSLGPPVYDYDRIYSERIPSEMKQELIRFLLCLELWERTPGEKKISAFEVWALTLTQGPAFAEELDDMFALTWREEDVDSYNFVFPARFLPKWEEHTNDLSLSYQATYSDPDVLEEFSIELDNLLEEVFSQSGKIRLPSDEEIILQRSTTTSYLADENRTLPHWEASLSRASFNTEELLGKRCVVQVYPSGTRDTIIADITANNSIRWIERALRHILQYVPESAVTLHSSTSERRIEDVVYTKGYHVLRDIKKCGLTYNVRDLFPIVRKKIEKYFPDKRWERFNIYSHLKIRDGNTEREALRGYGLGMANHTVTLCNIVIHRMCRKALTYDGDVTVKGKAIVGNDDCDVVFFPYSIESKSVALEYLELEHDIHGRLGNLTNFKKSVVKPFGLFYEQYSKKGWKEKESLVCNAIACAYLAPTIRIAKHYIASQSDRFTSLWARRELRALAAYWGGEFFDFKEELRINFEIGGWLNTGECGLKSTLCDIEKLAQKYSIREISFAERMCKEYLTPPRALYKTPGQVSNLYYFGPSMKTDNRIQLYTIVDDDLRSYYKKLTSFERNYASRISKFEGRVKLSSLTDSLDTLYKRLLKVEPWYMIPEYYIWHKGDWGSSDQLTYLSETAQLDDDPISLLTSAAMDGREIHLPNLKWDPKIPLDVMDKNVYCSSIFHIMASQFSNSGFLPLYEYYQREGVIPLVKLFSDLKPFYTYDQKRDKLTSKLCFFWVKRRRKEEYIQDEPEEIYPDDEDREILTKDLLDDFRELGNRHETGDGLVLGQESALADSLLQRIQGMVTGNISIDNTDLGGEVNVFDTDDDSPLGLDF